MTDTFRVNAKTVDFRALSAKYPQNGTFFTTTRKLSIVNQNEVYGEMQQFSDPTGSADLLYNAM